MVGVAVIACGIALKPDRSVLNLVSYAWAGFRATFGPLILMSLYWKQMTLNGAIAGSIGGGATVLLWGARQGGIFELYEIVPGFAISIACILLFSLMDKPPSDRITVQFDAARSRS